MFLQLEKKQVTLHEINTFISHLSGFLFCCWYLNALFLTVLSQFLNVLL